MTIRQRRARALKIEREIDDRLAKLRKLPVGTRSLERLRIKRLRTEATRLAA